MPSLSPEEIFLSSVFSQNPVNKDQAKPPKVKKAKSSPTDLHGLNLSAAVSRIQSILSRNPGQSRFIFVTGKGRHSEGMYSVLKCGIEEFLEHNANRLKIDFQMNENGVTLWRK